MRASDFQQVWQEYCEMRQDDADAAAAREDEARDYDTWADRRAEDRADR